MRLTFAAFALFALFLLQPTSVLAAPPTIQGFQATEVHSTRVLLELNVNPPQQETKFRETVEYATSKQGPRVLLYSQLRDAAVSNSPADSEATGLAPATKYYFFATVENNDGKSEGEIEVLTQPVAPPEFDMPLCDPLEAVGEYIGSIEPERELCAGTRTTSIALASKIWANGADTSYQFEYARQFSGPWLAAGGTGGSGMLSAAEESKLAETRIEGLLPETTYFVRIRATNEKGSSESREGSLETKSVKPGEPRSPELVEVAGHSAKLSAGVYPGTFETQWQFEIAESEAGPWTPFTNGSGVISAAQAGEEPIHVNGEETGLDPGKTYYARVVATNANGTSTSTDQRFVTGGPPRATTYAVHGLHGGSVRAMGSVLPDGTDTHYRFEYVTQRRFEATGFAEAQSTGPVDVGSGEQRENGLLVGFVAEPAGADLSGLQAGETYVFRVVAENEAGTAFGAAQTVLAPSAVPVQQESCPNAQLRVGPSALLPDCRAYEQLTPVDKEGAQEIFSYLPAVGQGVKVGLDGDHVVLGQEAVTWGSGPAAGQGPYFFDREASGGWRMTAAAQQPETGVSFAKAELFSTDLSSFAFERSYSTSPFAESPMIEFGYAVPGSPPKIAAEVPRATGGEWAAGSADLSTAILQSADRTLAGHNTNSTSGEDLYEYRPATGKLSQLNVTGSAPGTTIGRCGALLVKGLEGVPAGHLASSPNAVSADGSHVFFEAVPSSNCSEPRHLYLRLNGAETRDIGPYRFLAATRDGGRAFLESTAGGAHQVLLYNAETGTTESLFSLNDALANLSPDFSDDLGSIYFRSKEALTPEAPEDQIGRMSFPSEVNLYRYDVATRTLRFIAHTGYASNPGLSQVTPDGRYYYWGAGEVAGLPGGSGTTSFTASQIYRYDSVEDVIECISCASSFDPEPGLASTFAVVGPADGRAITANGTPEPVLVSGNGDFAFFDTAAALVPGDVDGEVEPEGILRGSKATHGSEDYSVSSDVYEWRRDGIDGCEQLQGCLALITNGRGGYLNLLLGSAQEGRDVFIYTSSQLGPRDVDTAGDIYDVRVGGGETPAPSRPVECEGDACFEPLPAPNDATPASGSYQGPGNLRPATKRPRKPRKAHRKSRKAPRKRHKSRRNRARRHAAHARRSSVKGGIR